MREPAELLEPSDLQEAGGGGGLLDSVGLWMKESIAKDREDDNMLDNKVEPNPLMQVPLKTIEDDLGPSEQPSFGRQKTLAFQGLVSEAKKKSNMMEQVLRKSNQRKMLKVAIQKAAADAGKEQSGSLLISPSNPWKLNWDMLVNVFLLYSCIATPA